MSKNQKGLTIFILVFFFVCFAAVTTAAEECVEYHPRSFPVADVTVGPHGITFQPKVEYGTLVLIVSKPDGRVDSQSFASGITPYLELAGDFIDGSYTYELRVIPVTGKKIRKVHETAGMEQAGVPSQETLAQTGYFFIKDGRFVTPQALETGIAKPLDIVHPDDVIIDGSLCVGNDCYSGLAFGYDTIVLMENNLRIYFNDTSYAASYPTTDWRITINDYTNGGASYFSVDDVDNGASIFKIEAGAPSNSLYVEDYGRVGLGTSTPVVELHIKDSDTPTLRLEQDSSGGWTAQTWDVAGNESNFFIRDATNGSRLPFRIQPSTPSSTLCLKSDGKVGIGTWSPAYKFEIETTGEDAFLYLDRTDGAQIILTATTNEGQIGTESNHPLNLLQNNQTVMTITDATAGNTLLTMKDGGTYDGKWNNASSRELKENITALAPEDAMSTLEGLEPVRYNYKGSREEEHVGFIAEDVPNLVANNGRKNLSPMDIVAVLTKVVQEQQETIVELKKRIENLEKR